MRTLWNDRRGVAMAEGVVVIPVFIVIWLGLNTAHHVWAAKLQAQNDSLGRALAASRGGACDGGTQSMDEVGGAAPGGDEVRAVLDHADSGGGVFAAVGVLPFGFSHHTGTAARTASVPELFGGPEQTVGGRNRVMCNMPPQDGLIDVVADFLGTLLR